MKSSTLKAILGATNTGKTHSAILKMKEYNNGVIGFPLRLLARENFEKGKKIFGNKNVALITGEEKIVPIDAKYFFCTVESMPKKYFEFVAVDEIQLAADFERGHHFTEKIINFRGTKETWFLGSNSIKNILKSIIPEIKIINKPRLSNLKYFGYKNLTRIPKRSAVIAFSQVEIYALAEKLKKFKGGVSIITGALSPEARNKQLKLFENGEVDYIVATDAIGLGLNLNIKHVFFSNIIKFDGRRQRYLTFDEISQIAGRAGRYENDGYFGVTENLKKFNNELVEFIEDYKSSELKYLYWRNSKLDFSLPKDLIRSLTKKSKNNLLVLKKNSDDIESLKILVQDEQIKKELIKKNIIELLWDICSIPNYTRNLVEYHTEVLRQISFYLILKKDRIPNSFVKKKIDQILIGNNENISSINLRITKIRIWSYISYKKNWLEEPKSIQSKIKEIEEILSSKLHKRLTQKFIDSYFVEDKFYKNGNQNNSIFFNKNELFVNKKMIGKLEGFNLKLSVEMISRKKEIFFQKFLKKKIDLLLSDLISQFVGEDLNNLNFTCDGKIYWRNSLIGNFVKGKDLYNPIVRVFVDHNFDNHRKFLITKKLEDFLEYLKNKYLKNFYKLLEECKNNDHSSSFRALSYALYENLGYCPKKTYYQYYKNLLNSEVNFLNKLGLEIGNKFIYFKNEKFEKKYFSHMLISVFQGLELSETLSKKLFIKENSDINDKAISKISNKFGFYKLMISKKKYLVYFLLFEKLSHLINDENKKNKIIPKKIRKYCEYDTFFLRNFCRNKFILLHDKQINT